MHSHRPILSEHPLPHDRLHQYVLALDQIQPAGPFCLFLPSILNLAKLLHCSPLDVQTAMVHLAQQQGYSFLSLGPDSPITLCPQ